MLWYFLSIFRLECGHSLHQWVLNHLGLHDCNHLAHMHGRYMSPGIFVTHVGVHRVATAPSSLCWGMHDMTKMAVPSHSINTLGHTVLGIQQSYLIIPPSLHGRKRSSFLFSKFNTTW